jgi:hypothetical protein
MRSPGGYAFSFDVGGVRQEADTFTCYHCNTIVIVKPKCDPYDLGGMCRLCEKMICPKCVDIGSCDPLEEKLKRAETAYHARRSYEM